MVFSSIPFLYVFLPVVLLIYFLCPMSRKNLVLMVSGFLFYAWGEPVYVLLMLFSTLLDYTAGRVMERYRENPKIRKAALLTSVIINLSLLAVFKYSSFLVENINALFGISLFNPDSYINYAAYVSMFPQLVAGPIVRYDDVAAELENRTITLDKIGEGAFLFAQGLAKKVLLANNIGILWTNVKEMATAGSVPAVTAWLGILAFTFQIYFDFSGYSDMARGMGRMLGFDFPDNFRYPYMSKSITDFWRRWHMTLGSWFRSYVYIPLGGNRKGTARTIRNLLITWMLTGLWHGASWNFLLWGLYFGVLLIIEKFFLGKYLEKLPGWLQQTYSFLLVVFGWVLFEMETPALIGGFFGSMVGFGGFADKYSVYLLASYGLLMVLCMIASNNWVPRLVEMAGKKFPRVVSGCKPVYIVLALVFGTAFLVNSTYNPFLYFRF